MQFQADILNTEVIRPKITETTALGAAYLAGLAAGYWKDIDEIRTQWQAERKFEPENANTDQIAQEKAGWLDAMKRTLTKNSKIKL